MSDGLCHACATELTGAFCGQCGAWNSEGEPPTSPERVCPVCGTVNSPSNRHCQSCAFRLDRGYEPPPKNSPGRMVVAGSILLMFALTAIFVINRSVGGDEQEGPPNSGVGTSTVPNASTDSVVAQEESSPLTVSSVSASSNFSNALGADNLIDEDLSTYWNDASQHGEDAEFVFEFTPPVAIDSVVINNLVDETAFTRNFRIRSYEITTDDLPIPISGELADTQGPQTISLNTTLTARLVFRVTSTYSAAPVDDLAAFEELAVAEVTFLGRPVP